MYCPRQFVESRPSVLSELIHTHPLGTWTCWADNQLVVNHIPFVLDETTGEFGTLVAHVAKANPIWTSLTNNVPSVVVFQGAQTYISPSWYPSKQEHGKVVPTWNYAVVHAFGQPKAIDDKDWLLAHVTTLSDTHETGRAVPWKISDAPEKFVDTMIKGIVGIEIPIQTLEGRWKVSQNKNAADKAGVVAGLSENSDTSAQEMADLIGR